MPEFTIERWKTKSLKNHPLNIQIYGSTPNPEFVASVKEHGVTTPLVILPDGTVVEGHCRRQAALMNDIAEVPVVVLRELTDPLLIERRLILGNKYRDKTTEQRTREFENLKRIEAELAKQRQSKGRPQSKEVPPNLAEDISPPKTGKKGEARKIAAEAVGMKATTAEKAVEVVHAIDEAVAAGDTERAEELRETLNNKSVSAAVEKVNEPKPPKPEQTEEQKLVLHADKAYTTLMTHIEKLRHLVDHRDSPGVFNKINAAMAEVHNGIQKLKKFVA